MNELKKCPFCGNTTALRIEDQNELDGLSPGDPNYSENPFYVVVCSVLEHEPNASRKRGCGAASGFRSTPEEAIAAWNRRADGWIPVGERMPEDCPELDFYDDGRLKFTTVLAVVDGHARQTNRLFIGKTGNSYLDEQATDKWAWSLGVNVTHWMPLPEPPKV